MTALDLLTPCVIILAFCAAGLLISPVARRSGLGWVHPGTAWLGLSAVFFGLGSGVLAATGEASGPGFYVAGAVLAFGIGAWTSDYVAIRRGTPGRPDRRHAGAGAAGRSTPAPGTRRMAALILAVAAVATVLPTLLEAGIPLLTQDITAARSELVGLPIQLIRVALPGLAGLLLLDALGKPERRGLDLAGIIVLVGFTVALASRYLAAELVAVLLIAWLLAERRIPAKGVLTIGIAGIVAFGGIQVARAFERAEGDELGFAVSRTVNRIVLVQPRTLAAFQRIVPAEQPYFLGLTWLRRVGPLVGRDDIPNLGYWIYPQVVEEPQGTAGYAAPGLVGEAWANFGPAGLALFVLLGILAERLGALMAARKASSIDLVTGALATLFLARTHAVGLGGLAILLAVLLAWRLLAGPPAGLVQAAARIATWRTAA